MDVTTRDPEFEIWPNANSFPNDIPIGNLTTLARGSGRCALNSTTERTTPAGSNRTMDTSSSPGGPGPFSREAICSSTIVAYGSIPIVLGLWPPFLSSCQTHYCRDWNNYNQPGQQHISERFPCRKTLHLSDAFKDSVSFLLPILLNECIIFFVLTRPGDNTWPHLSRAYYSLTNSREEGCCLSFLY